MAARPRAALKHPIVSSCAGNSARARGKIPALSRRATAFDLDVSRRTTARPRRRATLADHLVAIYTSPLRACCVTTYIPPAAYVPQAQRRSRAYDEVETNSRPP